MEPFPKAEEMVFPSVRDSDPLPVGMKNGPAAHLYREIRFIANKIRKKDIALKYESEWKYASVVMDRLNGLKKRLLIILKGRCDCYRIWFGPCVFLYDIFRVTAISCLLINQIKTIKYLFIIFFSELQSI
jgi:hypothetical protein